MSTAIAHVVAFQEAFSKIETPCQKIKHTLSNNLETEFKKDIVQRTQWLSEWMSEFEFMIREGSWNALEDDLLDSVEECEELTKLAEQVFLSILKQRDTTVNEFLKTLRAFIGLLQELRWEIIIQQGREDKPVSDRVHATADSFMESLRM